MSDLNWFGNRPVRGSLVRNLVRGDILSGVRETKKARFPRPFLSTPNRIRTYNLRFRRPMLYPVELWVQNQAFPVCERFTSLLQLSLTPALTPGLLGSGRGRLRRPDRVHHHRFRGTAVMSKGDSTAPASTDKPNKPHPDFPLSPTPRSAGQRRSAGKCTTLGHGTIPTRRSRSTTRRKKTFTRVAEKFGVPVDVLVEACWPW